MVKHCGSGIDLADAAGSHSITTRHERSSRLVAASLHDPVTVEGILGHELGLLDHDTDRGLDLLQADP
jgi:hypothetical protein